MGRASEALKAERLNHARKLLQRFDHLPDAVAQMVKDCGLSPRQVYTQSERVQECGGETARAEVPRIQLYRRPRDLASNRTKILGPF